MADGFEDVEALGTRDVLLRGGVDVKTVSITDTLFVASSHDLMITCDTTLYDMLTAKLDCTETTDKDMMIFPGGMPGSVSLGSNRSLMALMNRHFAAGGSVAAICAAPAYVLSNLDAIYSAAFTCYEGCEQRLIENGAKYMRKPAVTSGRIITGRGPGHAIDFGLAILKYLRGEDAARKVSEAMTLECE